MAGNNGLIDPATELFVERALTAWTEKMREHLDARDAELYKRIRDLENSDAKSDGRRDNMHIILTTVGVILGGSITLIVKHLLHW